MTSSLCSSWSVLVPVKRLAAAKTRLAPALSGYREELALAFAIDTVTAVSRCPRVTRIVVVTGDERVAVEMRRLGASVVSEPTETGVNAALLLAADFALRSASGAPVAALPADLPALQADELTQALTAAENAPVAFVADCWNEGTTLLAARDGRSGFAPAYGPDSARRHRQAGARALCGELATLRRDVDRASDLDAVTAMGVGAATAAMLAGAPARL